MKAIGYNSYGDIDNLEILKVAEPRPKRSEVIVKIEAVSLNPCLLYTSPSPRD